MKSRNVGESDEPNDPHRYDNLTRMKIVLPVGKQKAWECYPQWHCLLVPHEMRGKGRDRRGLGICLARTRFREVRGQVLGGEAFRDTTKVEEPSDTTLLFTRSHDDSYAGGGIPKDS